VPLCFIPRRRAIRALWLTAIAIACAATIPAARAGRSDQMPWDAVGTIDGDDIVVSGSMSVDVINGRHRTILRNGSDVRVRTGTARVDLIEGGQISICGPAHFSVLKSATNLTVALENGTIRARIEREPTLTIYTALIQAHPISIGDGPQDILLGFDAAGEVCIKANRGAIRIEQQLTGQTMVVPQTGDILLANGQLETLRTGASQCYCELETAKAAPTMQPDQVGNGDGRNKNALDANPDPLTVFAEKLPAKEQPIYEVYMPPLIYDAKAKVQPGYDPYLIVLVRRVRVRPALLFRGRVEGEVAPSSAPAKPAPTTAAGAAQAKTAPPANDSFANRVRSFVRKLWSH